MKVFAQAAAKTLVLALALALLAGPALAKSCKKGKPCGNTCIAATKTCRK